MPSYTCTKCARVFKQKSGYDDHLAKKKDCLETTAIAAVVQETVKQEVRRQTRLTELVLPEDPTARDEALQAFFEALAAECRRPHVGDAFKTFTHALLLRAQEARIYTPEEHS